MICTTRLFPPTTTKLLRARRCMNCYAIATAFGLWEKHGENRLWFRDECVKVFPMTMDFAWALIMRPSHNVPLTDIRAGKSTSLMRTHLSRLRPRLARLGFNIRNHHGIGYELERIDHVQPQERKRVKPSFKKSLASLSWKELTLEYFKMPDHQLNAARTHDLRKEIQRRVDNRPENLLGAWKESE